MKKFLAILFAVVLLAAAIPTTSASAGGGDITPYWEFYNNFVPGEVSAKLIHSTDVHIYEAYGVECNGDRSVAEIGAPWPGVQWIYEEGEVRLKELGALVSWYDPATETWGDSEWITAKQSCGESEVKAPVWTGRWVHTYPGNFWCNLVSFDKNPSRFRNSEYVDDSCGVHWLVGDWQGGVDYKVFKEMKLSNGDLKAGNHYYVPAGQ